MKATHLKISSLSENLRVVESFIDNIKENHHLTDNLYGNIMIAVTEAVNNAILHGNKSQTDKNVSIFLKSEDFILTFRIEDEGSGFDFKNLPDPTSPENVRNPSGRGIFLMKHLSDEVVFLNQGAVVELAFYINS